MVRPFGRLPRNEIAAVTEEAERLLAFTDPDVATREVSVAAPG